MARKRVFLGTVAVVPRADLKRHMERPMSGQATDVALQAHLDEVFQLPPRPPADQIGKDDLGIDVFVSKHQSGESWSVEVGEFGFPLLWRPAVEVRSRIYLLGSGKTVAKYHVRRKMSWSEYLSRSFSLKGIFAWGSPFRHQDISRLLDGALIEILERARAKL